MIAWAIKLAGSKLLPWVLIGVVAAAGAGAAWFLWHQLRAADKEIGRLAVERDTAIEEAKRNADVAQAYRDLTVIAAQQAAQKAAELAQKQQELLDAERAMAALPPAAFPPVDARVQPIIRGFLYRPPAADAAPDKGRAAPGPGGRAVPDRPR